VSQSCTERDVGSEPRPSSEAVLTKSKIPGRHKLQLNSATGSENATLNDQYFG